MYCNSNWTRLVRHTNCWTRTCERRSQLVQRNPYTMTTAWLFNFGCSDSWCASGTSVSRPPSNCNTRTRSPLFYHSASSTVMDIVQRMIRDSQMQGAHYVLPYTCKNNFHTVLDLNMVASTFLVCYSVPTLVGRFRMIILATYLRRFDLLTCAATPLLYCSLVVPGYQLVSYRDV